MTPWSRRWAWLVQTCTMGLAGRLVLVVLVASLPSGAGLIAVGVILGLWMELVQWWALVLVERVSARLEGRRWRRVEAACRHRHCRPTADVPAIVTPLERAA